LSQVHESLLSDHETTASNPVKKPSDDSSTPTPSTPKSNDASDSTSASTSTKPKADGNKAFVDFFESIEQEQTSMFDPQTGSPSQTYFQQQAAFNPFLQQGQMPPSFGQQLAPQLTGAFAFGQPHMQMPQMTGLPAFAGAFGMSPFGQQQPQAQMMQPQPTGFLQPQATGVNPFRQSMIAPQMTGNPFGQQQQQRSASAGAFSPPQQQQQASSVPSVPQLQPQWTGMNAFQRSASGAANTTSPSSPARQSSTGTSTQPSFANAFGQQSQQPQPQQTQQQKAPHPLAPQQTGSKNPFAPPPGSSPPPVPQAPLPSMNQLAFNAFQNFQNGQQQQQQQPQQQNNNPQPAQQNNQAQANGNGNGFGAGSAFGDMFGSNNNHPQQQQQAKTQISQPTGLMGNLASDFAFGRALSPSNTNAINGTAGAPSGLPGNTTGNLPSFAGTSSASNSTSTPSFGFSSASSATGTTSQNTGSSFTPSSAFGQQFLGSSAQGQSPAPIQPQPTGFGGSNIKPFQPTSSFGASLYADQAGKGGNSGAISPPPAMPNQQQPQQQSSAAPSNNFFGAFGQDQQQQNNNPNGSNGQNSMGVGATPNPFRMSAMPGNAQPSAGNPNAFGAGNTNFFGGGGASQQNQPQQGNATNPSPWGSLI
jgi:hypothetical protein